MANLLVVVHPGSCCGSADFNLGKYDARACRDGIVHELNAWTGGIIVIDGNLSDELKSYPMFNQALDGAIDRARAAGLISTRIKGDPEEAFTQGDAAASLIESLNLQPATHRIKLTGAWFDPDEDTGCINDVEEVFSSRGFSTDVLDSAFNDGARDSFSP